MTQPPAIACTLGATGLAERRAELNALGVAACVDAECDRGRAVLRFRADAEERVRRAVAAEADCCAFLDFRLERAGDELVLTITAPEGAGEAAAELAAMFAGRR